MYLKFGLNKYLPIWMFFSSATLLLVIDVFFYKSQVEVDIVEAKTIYHSKGTSCELTISLQGKLYTRTTLNNVCHSIHIQTKAILNKTELLDRWVSLKSDMFKDITEPFDTVHILDWICFLLIIILPLASRFELKRDLMYAYYFGITTLLYYSFAMWFTVFKT